MKILIKRYWTLLHTYLRTQWIRIIVLLGLVAIKITLRLVNPQIIRAFLDQALAGAALNMLLREGAAFFVIAIATQILTVANVTLGETVAWTATNALRIDLLRHCLGLDMTFHKAHTPGELTERIDSDVDVLSNFFSNFVVNVIGNSVLALAILVLMYIEGWQLGLTFTLYSIVGLYIMMRLRNVTIPHWTKLHEIRAQFYGFMGEQLDGTEDICANGTQPYVLQRFTTFIRRWLPIDRNASLAGYSGWMLNAALVAVGESLAFGLAGYLWFTKRISIGSAYLLVEYSMLIYSQVAELRWQITDLQHAEAGIERIQALLNLKSRLPERDIEPLPTGPLSVEFHNVSFAYDDEQPTVYLSSADSETMEVSSQDDTPIEQPMASDSKDDIVLNDIVLNDISFRLEPGQVLGLLGRTGSGKTTLARLILRLYDPGEGRVCLGDVALTDTSISHLRQRVAYVTQDVQLFQASVRDNLCLFRPDVPDTAINSALDNLGLRDWLESLPSGLDSELGSDGSGLSAGQAQLLAFARVFLTNPDLVILDEASSRLDPATEKLIDHAVDCLLKDRTGIVIAHRLNTVARADEVLILDNGCIREMGNRAQLAGDPTSHFHHLLETGMAEVLA